MSKTPGEDIDATAPAIRRLLVSLVALSVVLLLISVGLVSRAALNAFEEEVRPALEQEATVLGGVVASPIELALEVGVPFDELTGVQSYFDTMLAGRSNVAYLVLAAPDGRPAFRAGPSVEAFQPLVSAQVSEPVQRRELAMAYDTAIRLGPTGEAPRAWLHVGMSRAPLEAALADTRWDVLIVLVVGVILVVEFLRYVMDRAVTAPLASSERVARRLAAGDFTLQADESAPDEAGRLARSANALLRRLRDRWARLQWLASEVAATGAHAAAEAQRVTARVAARIRFQDADVSAATHPPNAATARLPLFLFVFAEQLSTSFIPLHSLDLVRAGRYATDAGLLAALPLAAFVAAVALATPQGGRMAATRGTRDTILIGGGIAMLGFLGAALATTLEHFVLARMLCGVGYALVSIACQAQMALTAPRGRLAGSLGSFTGAVMTGAVCGTAIGAVMADRIGYEGTFLASVILTGAVVMLALRHFPAGAPAAAQAARTSLLQDARLAFRSPAFAALLLLAAAPAKIVLTGFVFYLAPLALRDLGLSQSAIGRYVMLYGFCMLPAIALGAWLADRLRIGGTLIWVAAIMNGAALMLPLVMPLGTALPIAIAATGLAQGLASAPMLAAVAASAKPGTGATTPVLLAFLRLGERLGSFIGPLVAAWWLLGAGMAQTVAVIGIVSAATGAAYAVALLIRRIARPAAGAPA